MQIAFISKSLRTVCENQADADAAFGAKVAEVLRHRLADLRAAEAMTDLIAGRPQLDDVAEQAVMELCDGYQIIISVNHPTTPKVETGTVNWEKVTRVKIVAIEVAA